MPSILGLLPPDCKSSIHEEFLQLHNNPKYWTKEAVECGFKSIEGSQRQDKISGERAHWNAYRQLWLFAMRHFPEMTGHPPRKDISKLKPLFLNFEKLWWYAIARLADLCGYKSVQTPYRTADEAEMEMTKIFLASIRPAPFQLS